MPESAGRSSVVTCTVRVRYAETDAAGVAYYANYLVWFEVARGAFCRARGLDYSALGENGLFLPVIDVRCRYRSSARYDEDLTIEVWCTEAASRRVRFEYRILRDGTLLAEGHTVHMPVDREGRPRSLPADVRERFGAEAGRPPSRVE